MGVYKPRYLICKNVFDLIIIFNISEYSPDELVEVIKNENHVVVQKEGEGAEGRVLVMTHVCVPIIRKHTVSPGWRNWNFMNLSIIFQYTSSY